MCEFQVQKLPLTFHCLNYKIQYRLSINLSQPMNTILSFLCNLFTVPHLDFYHTPILPIITSCFRLNILYVPGSPPRGNSEELAPSAQHPKQGFVSLYLFFTRLVYQLIMSYGFIFFSTSITYFISRQHRCLST